MKSRIVIAGICAAALAGCAETSRLPAGADVGANPVIAPPAKTLLPTVNVAPASALLLKVS